MKSKPLINLFKTFFSIGLFTFGGGYGMLALVEEEIVVKRKLLNANDMLDIMALSQTLPGVIAVNLAALTGFKALGKKGCLVATAGVILPSFFVIIIVANFFSFIQDNLYVQYALVGIRASVVALILSSAIKMYKPAIVDKFTLGVMTVAFCVLVFTPLNPIYVIISGIILSLVVYAFIPKLVEQIVARGEMSQ